MENQNIDEKCIRYLMREMDPSEEIEFERAMLKDENLLIEVESLRITYNHIQTLPLKHPPVEVSNLIKEKAEELAQKRRRFSFFKSNSFTRNVAAAAVLLLVVSLGWYNISDENVQNEMNSSSVIQGVQPLTPWVDNKEVIRISQPSTNSLQIVKESEIQDSYKKLKLVKERVTPQKPVNSYILTSSPSNN